MAVVEARVGTVQKMALRQSQLLVVSYEADRRKPPAVDEPGSPRPAKSCDGLVLAAIIGPSGSEQILTSGNSPPSQV